MEDVQHNPLLGWAYLCHSKDTEELMHSLLYLTLELETTRSAAREEILRRDDQLLPLRLLLEKAVVEKEEALEKSKMLIFDNLLLTQQLQQQFTGGVSAVEDDPPLPLPPPPSCTEFESNNNNMFSSLSSSDSDESIVSSTGSAFLEWVPEKPLPEKWKLLQAVMKAGHLLQTLLLAGPLPQWKHPPPTLEPFNIPLVGILVPPQPPLISTGALSGLYSRKRVRRSPHGDQVPKILNPKSIYERFRGFVDEVKLTSAN